MVCAFVFNNKKMTSLLGSLKGCMKTCSVRTCSLQKSWLRKRLMPALLQPKFTHILHVTMNIRPTNPLIFDFKVELNQPAKIEIVCEKFKYQPKTGCSKKHRFSIVCLRASTTYRYCIFILDECHGLTPFRGKFTTGALLV